MTSTRNGEVRADSGELAIRRLGQPGDLGWVVKAHGEVYADEFGWEAPDEPFHVVTALAPFPHARLTPIGSWSRMA